MVCDLVVVSKDHKVSAGYRPELSRVQVRRAGVRSVWMQPDAGKALKAMFAAAAKAGHKLAVRSSYRSYATQKSIYSPGETLTAPAGASEHQTGLAADLAAIRGRHQVRGYAFGRAKAGAWVRRNAARFGFILRYPNHKQKITRIPYEPWHFRYVGVEAAKGVAKTKSKTLEEYLGLAG